MVPFLRQPTHITTLINKAARWGLYGGKHPLELAQISSTADTDLFNKDINDPNHVLHDLLPPKKAHGYNLRKRPHQHMLPIKNIFADKNFLYRMLFVDMTLY